MFLWIIANFEGLELHNMQSYEISALYSIINALKTINSFLYLIK